MECSYVLLFYIHVLPYDEVKIVTYTKQQEIQSFRFF